MVDSKTENERLAVVEQQVLQISNAVTQLSADIREWQKNKVSKVDMDLMMEIRDQKMELLQKQNKELRDDFESFKREQSQNKKSFIQNLPAWIGLGITVLSALAAVYEFASNHVK